MERKWDFCLKLVTYSSCKQWIIYMFLYSRSITIGLVFWTDFGFQPSSINWPCRGHTDILMAYPQFSRSVMSDSLPPHVLQHARLLCPSPILGACTNSCPLSQWFHPTISSSVIPFSSYLQSFPASGSFPVNQFFASSGQSIGASASALVLQWVLRTDFL